MRILTTLCFALIISGGAAAEENLSDQTYPDHSRLMYYLDSVGITNNLVRRQGEWGNRLRIRGTTGDITRN